MKRKIVKYLESKEKSKYDNIDRILEMYLAGEIKKILSQYEGVGIHPSIHKDEKEIQLEYNFNNIYVIIDFFIDKYNVVVYQEGISVEGFEKLFTDYDYPDDFDLRELIKELDLKIKSHPKLKDTTLIKKKRKLYTLISWICRFLPIVIVGIIAIYTNISKKNIVDVWGMLFIFGIPFLVGYIFDAKSKNVK